LNQNDGSCAGWFIIDDETNFNRMFCLRSLSWPDRKPETEEPSMTVLKVGFVGIRSDRLDETVALFRDVIGVPVTRQTDDLVGFRFADGTVLELYGPADEFHAFFTTGPVVAFRVDDFDVTHRAMLAAGVDFIGDVQHADGVSWQHFHCPDGTVLEISGPSRQGRTGHQAGEE
jgi:catechol 2,3-dioxygenase-like lactoylglutathione lyase family enzyme